MEGPIDIEAPVGWGLVGCGWVARDYAMPAILGAEGARLVAGCDPDPAARAHLPEGTAAVSDLGEMLAMPEVEAVYVATPNWLHATQTVAALHAGKHVLCEKPMALSPADAEAMAEAAAETGCRYATAYDQRHHPAHERLADWVAEGRLGTVTQARIHYACWLPADWAARNWRTDPTIAGGGAAMDLAPHGIDLLSAILGEAPAHVAALLQRRVHRYAVDDGAVVTLAFPSGCLASLHVAYNCPDILPRRRLELIGTRGMALAENTMGQTPGGRLLLTDAVTMEVVEIDFAGEGAPFPRQIERFSRALRGHATDACFAAPDADAALTGRLLDALAAAPTPKEGRHAS